MPRRVQRAEVIERIHRDAERSALWARNGLRHLSGVGHVGVGLSPRELVWSRDKVQLFRYDSDRRSIAPPVLLVMSLVTKAYVFDLRPGSSLVERLTDRGFDVFLLDWGIPDVVEAHNTLETYCDEYLPLASRAVLQVAVADELTVFGYGFGGVLSMLSTAGHPEVPVRNLVVQATPIDFSELGPAVVFLRRGNLDTDELLDETGNLPAASVYDSLRLLRPTADLSSYADLWQHLHDNEFLKSYQALIGWARDHIPFPGCTFRQVVDLLIRQELLATGRVPLGQRIVDLADIRCPVLNIVGAKDHLVPPSSNAPISRLLATSSVTNLTLPAGHVGLIVGRQAQRQFIPAMLQWLETHSDREVA